MSLLSQAALLAKYNDPTTGLFRDQTTREIGPDDVQAFVVDIKDSVFFFSNHTTNNITEGGSNLFFTDARAVAALISSVTNGNIPYWDTSVNKFKSSPLVRDVNGVQVQSGKKFAIGVAPETYQFQVQAELETVTNIAFKNSAGQEAFIVDFFEDNIRFGIFNAVGTPILKFRSNGLSFIDNNFTIGEALDDTDHAQFNINAKVAHTDGKDTAVNYPATIRRKSTTNGHQVAMGFAVDTGNTSVGGYIAFERTGTSSMGIFRIGNKLTTGTAPEDVIAIGAGVFGINVSNPTAYLSIKALTQVEAMPVMRLQSVKTNTTDNPEHTVHHMDKLTANGTATNMGSITIPANTTVLLSAMVVGRRTGGSAGTAEDGAAYRVEVVVKNVAGTATIIGVSTTTVIGEDQPGWTADWVVVGGLASLRVTGATNNNVSWHAHIDKYRISA